MSDDLTRPIIGIENRTPQEVFDIMADRFRALSASIPNGEAVAYVHPNVLKALQAGGITATVISTDYHATDPSKKDFQPLYASPTPVQPPTSTVPSGRDEAIAAVRAAQDVLAEYIVPDSSISDFDCVNRLLAILDDQVLVRALKSTPPPTVAEGAMVVPEATKP